MSCRIIQTADEVVFISKLRRDDVEHLQVLTVRSQPEEPVLTTQLGPRWSYSPDQASDDKTITPSSGSRWSYTPES